LRGGFYLYKRFQEGNGQGYTPILLTEPGSVFVLEVVEAPKAEQLINIWLHQGLPVPDWANKHFARNGQEGADWSNLPFIPRNGFGEIAVNLSIHWERRA
jgi:hypothetical protein